MKLLINEKSVVSINSFGWHNRYNFRFRHQVGYHIRFISEMICMGCNISAIKVQTDTFRLEKNKKATFFDFC